MHHHHHHHHQQHQQHQQQQPTQSPAYLPTESDSPIGRRASPGVRRPAVASVAARPVVVFAVASSRCPVVARVRLVSTASGGIRPRVHMAVRTGMLRGPGRQWRSARPPAVRR
jgi:hypothetical protein